MAESPSTTIEEVKKKMEEARKNPPPPTGNVYQDLPDVEWTDRQENKFATVLIYTPPRWGKTRLARTAANPLVLATELGATKGLQTLKSDHIPFIPFNEEDTLLKVVRYLRFNGATYKGTKYDTIILDSASQAGSFWIQGFMQKKNWDMLWDKAKGEGKDPRNAYSYAAERGYQLMKELFEIPAHVVVLCREGLMEEGDANSKVVYAVPELPGQKLPRELPGWPDGVLHGEFVSGKRVLRTVTHMRAVAGIRSPEGVKVPEFISPNLDLICRLVTGDPSVIPALTVGR